MLNVSRITKSFGGLQAIRGSDFSIEKGKTTALIGPNGAGKTTLFDIISGYTQADTGEVVFKDQQILGKPPYDIANMGMSRTFQQVRLFKYLTIRQHIHMTTGNSDMNLIDNVLGRDNHEMSDYQYVLDEFGIKKSLDALVSNLSYGQRKLLHIAMALKKKHDLLMLDEPVAGVNAVIQEKIENLLVELKEKGQTMLIIDHDMQFVRRLADHVIMLDAGSVVIQGDPEVVLQDERVLNAYLGV